MLVAAGALVLTLPPAGLATLRAPTRSAAVVAPITPMERSGPFRSRRLRLASGHGRARFVADWAADSGDSRGLPYLILDKRDARLYVFDARGRLIDSSPVLLGAAPGDDSVEGIGSRPMAKVRPEEKTTPAGRFVAEAGHNASGEEVVWVDYGAAVSMHRVRLVDPKERRLERLASPDPAERRISYGCINVPVPFFESVVWPLLRTTRAVAYVRPETRSVGEVFAGAYDEGTKAAVSRSAWLSAFPDKFPDISPVVPGRPPPAATILLLAGHAHRRPGGESGCRSDRLLLAACGWLCAVACQAAPDFAAAGLGRRALRGRLLPAPTTGTPFAVVDKRDARIYVFAAGGRLLGASAVLLGVTPVTSRSASLPGQPEPGRTDHPRPLRRPAGPQ